MNSVQIREFFEGLMNLPHETECVEFKEARSSFSFDKLGKYVSALANEANLKDKPFGWLVFGITNKPRTICGTAYRQDRDSLDRVKHEIARESTHGHSVTEIHELNTEKGRVLLFQIPPAPRGTPVAWKGHWYGRDGESLAPLSLGKLDLIRTRIWLSNSSNNTAQEAGSRLINY